MTNYMGFIEVYNGKDRDKLLEMGLKLVKSTEYYNGQKYSFVNPQDLKLNFDDMKIVFTKSLHF